MIFIYGLVSILTTTTGQILLKKGASGANKREVYFFVVLGYTFFFFAVLISYILLKLIQMKYFTVVMSLNYVSVMFASRIFLNEKLDRPKVIGTLLIAVGVLIFLYK
jgi:drug/metabolite transporter (DMT)-like permease